MNSECYSFSHQFIYWLSILFIRNSLLTIKFEVAIGNYCCCILKISSWILLKILAILLILWYLPQDVYNFGDGCVVIGTENNPRSSASQAITLSVHPLPLLRASLSGGCPLSWHSFLPSFPLCATPSFQHSADQISSIFISHFSSTSLSLFPRCCIFSRRLQISFLFQLFFTLNLLFHLPQISFRANKAFERERGHAIPSSLRPLLSLLSTFKQAAIYVY